MYIFTLFKFCLSLQSKRKQFRYLRIVALTVIAYFLSTIQYELLCANPFSFKNIMEYFTRIFRNIRHNTETK